jgi:hypothetical protein
MAAALRLMSAMSDTTRSNHQHRTDGDRGVGDVEDGKPLQVDEIHHGTTQPCLTSEQSVDQVADGTTHDHPRRNCRNAGRRTSQPQHDHDDDDEPQRSDDRPGTRRL